MDNRPIGVFDSGLGGLTCVSPIKKKLPKESIIYFGDTARTPYGSKSPATIKEFSLQIADFLVKNDVKALVIACNTISSLAIPDLEAAFPGIPVIGIVDSAAEEIARTCTEKDSIGIIATKATIKSKAYKKAVESMSSGLALYQMACPAFVSLIEEGIIENEIMDLTIRYYLDNFVKYHGLNTLVLGCTHYPLIRDNIERLYPQLRIINPSECLANAVQQTLSEEGLLAEDSTLQSTFYASDLSENFVNMINRIDTEDQINISLKKF